MILSSPERAERFRFKIILTILIIQSGKCKNKHTKKAFFSFADTQKNESINICLFIFIFVCLEHSKEVNLFRTSIRELRTCLHAPSALHLFASAFCLHLRFFARLASAGVLNYKTLIECKQRKLHNDKVAAV